MIRNKVFLLVRLVILLVLILGTLVYMLDRFTASGPSVSTVVVHEFPIEYEEHRQWVIKWHEGFDVPESKQFEVLQLNEERRIALIELQESVPVRDWYIEWIHREEIDYLEPDHTLKIGSASLSNDTHRPLQTYLSQIQAYQAWEIVRENTDITIAILDTGIDLQHPDLHPHLVPGINVLDPNALPYDDHGHGTQLAGVVGAVGNNEEGILGLLWSTKLMPVKVLPKEGEGSPFIVSQGIYQAIDHGADILLMSLGSPIFSQTLLDAVLYAEEQGVLVVAATGNEGGRVNYPAAFPTVLAVGAVNVYDDPESYSNAGPELHVVAPGTVYTTGITGKYQYATGTSLSAAQVAGLAGLVLKKFPDLTPNQVRNQIIYTAQDVHETGWDPKTGHGRINAWKAVTTPPVADIYEPNNSLAQAAMFPIESMVTAQLKSREDIDWFKIDSPYDGVITLQVDLEHSRLHGMEVIHLADASGAQTFRYHVEHSREIKLVVKKGISYLKLRFHDDERNISPLNYQMVSSFSIYSDKQEPNNVKEQAFSLKGDGELLTGTFHRDNIQDWFYIDIPQKGELDIHVSVDTIRLDPVLYFERPDGSSIRVDNGNVSNNQEERLVTDVERGRYYLRLHHYYDTKVNGEYFLRVTYRPYFVDKYEPNNKLEDATRLFFLQIIEANINTRDDEDWYRLRVQEERYVNVRAYQLPTNVGLRLELFNEKGDMISQRTQQRAEDEIRVGHLLPPGTYYLRVTAQHAFPFESYRLRATQQEMIGGYRDIQSTWAQSSILRMTEVGMFEGYGDYLFQPEEPVSRASMAQVLQRLYPSDHSIRVRFEDVSHKHWAYYAIQQTTGEGLMQEVEDGLFAPAQNITRAEAALILDHLIQRDPFFRAQHAHYIHYHDLDPKQLSYFAILRLTQLGIMQGYGGGFRPQDPLTRAEFVTIIQRIESQRLNHS